MQPGTGNLCRRFCGLCCRAMLMSCANAQRGSSQKRWVSESIVSWERDCVFGGRERERRGSAYSFIPPHLLGPSTTSHRPSAVPYHFGPCLLLLLCTHLRAARPLPSVHDLPHASSSLSQISISSGTGSPLSRSRREMVGSSQSSRFPAPPASN